MLRARDQKIQNFVPPDPSVRLTLPLSVAYGSDIEKVKKTGINAVKDLGDIIKEPKPSIKFLEMGESSLNFRVDIWVNNYINRFKVKDEANTENYNAINKAKIEIPFPQRDVHMKKE